MLSFSRASLLNVFVALAALIWLRRRQLGFRRIGMGLLLAVVVGSVATHYFLPAFTELYWNRLSNSAAYLFTSTEGVLSGRLSSWSVLADFLRENPFHALFGIGYKTLPYSTFIGQAVVGDNMYLTMLVETGVLGLAAFLALNFPFCGVLPRRRKIRPARVVLRNLDLLLLDGTNGANALRRSVHLLACATVLLLGARRRGALRR